MTETEYSQFYIRRYLMKTKTIITAALACACLMSVPASADIARPDPGEITLSSEFAENSLMKYSAEDPDTGEMIARMDRGEVPVYFEAGKVDDEDLPTITVTGQAEVAGMYGSIAGMEVTEKDVDEEKVSDDASTVIITFQYDDISPMFYFFVDGEDIYAFAGDSLVRVRDTDRVLEKVGKDQEKAAEDAKWLDNLEGAVLKAKQENWNLVNGAEDFVSEVEYAVMEDGTVYSREKYNLSGYDPMRNEKMTEEDLSEFMSVVKGLKGFSKNVDGTDGFGWRIWRPGKDGDVLYDFTGYAGGDGKLSRITSMLEKYRPFVVY